MQHTQHMDDRLYIFSPSGVYIETHAARIAKYKDRPNTILNPILDRVKGLPPSQWTLHNGHIYPKSQKGPLEVSLENKTRRHWSARLELKQALVFGLLLGSAIVYTLHLGGLLR